MEGPTEMTPAQRAALKRLADIADAYDRNELDDEARKWYGDGGVSIHPPRNVVLYQGRGGATLLTLQDCLDAREALNNGLPAALVQQHSPRPQQYQYCVKMRDAKRRLLVMSPHPHADMFRKALEQARVATVEIFGNKSVNISASAVEFIAGPNDPSTYDAIYGMDG